MQSLLKILARYSNFLVFIILEVVAFLLIAYNSAYPRSSILSTANSLVAWEYEKIDELGSYLSLREVNDELSQENAMLRNMLTDSSFYANYQSAKVVQMTIDKQHNYLTVNRGESDSIYRGMGVRNAEGAVGIIRTVGEHYSIVQPIINTASRLSCRFSKNDYIGTLEWDGKDSRYARLTDIATHVDAAIGDTIVTSGLSPAFPEGVPVGVITECQLKQGDSYYTIRVQLSVDFRKLKYVELIGNNNRTELEELNHGLE